MIHASNRQYLGAGALALAVHGLLFAALVFSVSWRSLPQLPVYADLWTELPVPPAPPPVLEAAPAPPVPPPVEQPEPAAEAPAQAEIREAERKALKAKEEALRRQQLEEARRQEAARQAAEEARRREEARLREEEERRRLEEARRLAREQVQRELEEDLARQMQEDLARETSQIKRRLTAQTQSAARLRMIQDYQDAIRGKIRGYLRLPMKLTGNPEVVFQVRLLPDGEVLRLSLLKSSGQPAYDEEVERAILKASPLPLPPDREVAAAFRDGLILKFRPREEGGAS